MLEYLEYIAAFILVIFILVTIHEYGHYAVARRCGVHVLRFSIGFGWPLFTWKSRSGTEFVLAGVPLGGYVKMLDEREAPVPDAQKHLAFNTKTPGQRIAIAAAGPLANFILAIAVYWILFTIGTTGLVPAIGKVDEGSPAALAGLQQGQTIVAVDGQATPSWQDVNLALVDRLGDTGVIAFAALREGQTEPSRHQVQVQSWLSDAEQPLLLESLGLRKRLPRIPAVVGSLSAGGRAEAAGLAPGDEVLAVDGAAVADWPALVDVIQANPETPLQLTALRAGATMELLFTPEAREQGGRRYGFGGLSAQSPDLPEDMLVKRSYPFYTAWLPAVARTWDLTIFTFEAIGKMLVGAISPTNISGPITIAKYAGDTAKGGFETFLGFLALLSISLAVINLLPIPVLDGGHLLYYFIELLAGRPLPEKVQALGLQIGLALVLGIMTLAIYFDLSRF